MQASGRTHRECVVAEAVGVVGGMKVCVEVPDGDYCNGCDFFVLTEGCRRDFPACNLFDVDEDPKEYEGTGLYVKIDACRNAGVTNETCS